MVLGGLGVIRPRKSKPGAPDIHHPRKIAAHDAAVAVVVTAKGLAVAAARTPFSSHVIMKAGEVQLYKGVLRALRRV